MRAMSVAQRRIVVLGGVAVLLVGGSALSRGPRKETPIAADAAKADDDASAPGGEITKPLEGLARPFAADAMGNGDVVVAAVDGQAGRVQRINGTESIVANKLVLRDVVPSPDAEMKVFAQPEGIYVLWRGLHEGKLGRFLVALDPDLKVRTATSVSSSVLCGTRTDLWMLDGERVTAHPYAAGATRSVALPKDRDASLLCSTSAAYAVLDADERTEVMALEDKGAVKPTTVLKDSEFGEDEQRELSEFTTADGPGFVRLAASGAIALREVNAGKAGTLHRLKTAIGRDDDVVAADASGRIAVIVYTEDLAEDGGDRACPRVMALRVDRQSFEETTLELSAGRCGFEVGPFFTSAVGDAVSVAWPERTGGTGQPRAPVVSLATSLVAAGPAPALARIDQAAEAMVDATCDANACYAVALTHASEGAPGVAKVVRYNAPKR